MCIKTLSFCDWIMNPSRIHTISPKKSKLEENENNERANISVIISYQARIN